MFSYSYKPRDWRQTLADSVAYLADNGHLMVKLVVKTLVVKTLVVKRQTLADSVAYLADNGHLMVNILYPIPKP